jgi:hypothetical protein
MQNSASAWKDWMSRHTTPAARGSLRRRASSSGGIQGVRRGGREEGGAFGGALAAGVAATSRRRGRVGLMLAAKQSPLLPSARQSLSIARALSSLSLSSIACIAALSRSLDPDASALDAFDLDASALDAFDLDASACSKVLDSSSAPFLSLAETVLAIFEREIAGGTTAMTGDFASTIVRSTDPTPLGVLLAVEVG